MEERCKNVWNVYLCIFIGVYNCGNHGIQLFCDILNYYFVIVLQESWDHINHGLFLVFFFFSSSFSILIPNRRNDFCVIAFVHAAAEEFGL